MQKCKCPEPVTAMVSFLMYAVKAYIMQFRIGCSGFYYKEWKEVFYPPNLPQRKWFDYYSERFDTLELNNTFYRFPTVALLDNWYKKSPSGFCFSVKAPRLFTHYKKFRDVGQLLGDFYSTIKEGLREKLGPVLFQFPANITYSEDLLHHILGQVDTAYTNVAEFRHASWWRTDVYQQLAEKKVVFSGMNHPSLPDQLVANNEVIYYRFHGKPKLYYSEYSSDIIIDFSRQLKALKNINQAFIYFNNTAGMGAIHNAEQLKKLLSVD